MCSPLLFLGTLWLCQFTSPEKIISADGNVIISGSDSKTRAAILSHVNELREELSFTVVDKEEGQRTRSFDLKNNLVISLYGKLGDEAPTRLFSQQIRAVGNSDLYRIELSVHLAKGLDRTTLRKQLLECLLLDRCLQSDLTGKSNLRISPWLLNGLLERFRWRAGFGERALYKSLYQRGAILDLEALLATSNLSTLNSAQRTAFRVSSGALVMSLLQQRQGGNSLQELIKELPLSEGEPILLLRQHFPQTGLSDESLAKWWALQLQVLTDDFITRTLNILETETALDAALQTSFEDEKGAEHIFDLSQYEQIYTIEDPKQKNIVIGKLIDNLQILSFTSFPTYRSLIQQYVLIVRNLGTETPSEEIPRRFEILRQERALLTQVGTRARNYLDWFQISSATQISGEFESFLNLKKQLETTTPPQSGPIGEYLDAIQNLYH